MAVIIKKEILERVNSGNLAINPSLDRFQLHPHAIDLRLGFTFLIPRAWKLTANGRESFSLNYFSSKNDKSNFEVVELEQGQYFELLPNEYVLASTLESLRLPNDLMGVLYPRSSTNRRGLSVDLTGIIDAGYEGQLTLPIRNNTASQIVKLYPGERFCQVVFEKLTGEAEARKSRYHQKDIVEGFITHNKTAGTEKEDEKEIQLIMKGDIRKLKEENKVK